ncbi:MAG: hypothetical protein JW855_04755 [Gammaproteobacteria bacterium]|nr:hypothetical protein [Gammaproteobacteria bacterium]
MKNLNAFIEKIDSMKKEHKLDLSSDQDLSIALMNLISIEEHFFFTGAKTGDAQYYNLLKEVREIRKSLLKKLIKNHDGEVWCISKHLLAASMRLMEVGTKQLGANNTEEAYEFFQKAYDVYSLFWGINLNLISTKHLKKIDDHALNKNDKQKTGLIGGLGKVVKKIIDCCIE